MASVAHDGTYHEAIRTGGAPGIEPEALERARDIASTLVPRALRPTFEATIGNLILVVRAGAAEAGWADSVARVGKRTLRRAWEAGVLLPLARTRGNELPAGILRALPGADAEYGEALSAVRAAMAEIEPGTSARRHLEDAEAFLGAVIELDDAYRNLAGIAFEAKRTSWKPVADRIRAASQPADRKPGTMRREFSRAVRTAGWRAADIAGFLVALHAVQAQPGVWPSLRGMIAGMERGEHARSSRKRFHDDYLQALADDLWTGLSDLVGLLLRISPHAVFAELTEHGSHEGGGHLNLAFRVGRATVEACLAFDVAGSRVTGLVACVGGIRRSAGIEGIGMGCGLLSGPADAIAALPVGGAGKWGAEAVTAEEAVVVPLSVHGNRDAEGLEAFLDAAEANGATIHVAAAGSIEIQAYLAERGFRWGIRRLDGYMTRNA